jgi:amino acid transporter
VWSVSVGTSPGLRAPATTTPLREPASLPPDSLSYRLKRKLLGKPLHSEELEHQRLGKPTALAVFASDNLSSSAYATEEILHVLIPVAGAVAFSLVVPVTLGMCVVLGFLILSYRETIKEYPSAGGAYLVTKDNFGSTVAQVAGASLLVDYILTVAVSASAGTAALTSAFDGLAQYRVPISLFFIAVIAWGNLRGVRESGRIFAIPTYFFMVTMAFLLGIGAWKYLAGDLPDFAGVVKDGQLTLDGVGVSGVGFLLGVRLYDVLHAFASGGAAVTGVEAISNGVPAFRKPEWRNARSTLVLMGTGLGVMFLGLSALAAEMEIRPFETGTPTVISQIGQAVFGGGPMGDTLYYALQAGTMLILIMAANTGFADFPRLASFQAGDSFLPRQLTKRGHRLVYSNGIIALAGAAMALVIITGAEVTRLIPLYAIGVFTGFTLSQSGMTKHHWRKREPGWRKGIVINGFGALLSGLVTMIVAVTKFQDGAWAILIILPLLVVVFLRLNRQYVREAAHLEADVPAAARAPILRRHVVMVFVDRLDLAAARAIQSATWPRSGPGSGSIGCSSNWSNAPTGGSPARRWRRSPARSPTARPRSASSCRTASSTACGIGSCTTVRRTPSPNRCPGCRTPTSPPCPSTSTSPTTPACRCRRSSGPVATGGPRRRAHGRRVVEPRRTCPCRYCRSGTTEAMDRAATRSPVQPPSPRCATGTASGSPDAFGLCGSPPSTMPRCSS